MKFVKFLSGIVSFDPKKVLEELETLSSKVPLGDSREKKMALLEELREELEDSQLKMRYPWLWQKTKRREVKKMDKSNTVIRSLTVKEFENIVEESVKRGVEKALEKFFNPEEKKEHPQQEPGIDY